MRFWELVVLGGLNWFVNFGGFMMFGFDVGDFRQFGV